MCSEYCLVSWRAAAIVYRSIWQYRHNVILAVACVVAKERLCDEKYGMIWRELRKLKHARVEGNVTEQ